MSTLTLLSPQATAWGDFDCGDLRITRKLEREAARAALGLQRLSGIVDNGEVVAVLTLRAGVLKAPMDVLFDLGRGEPDVPTVHVEVLAVRTEHQGRGLGRVLIQRAILLSTQLSAQIGIKTLSLEATSHSRAFYITEGFTSAQSPWPDGTWPMWLVL